MRILLTLLSQQIAFLLMVYRKTNTKNYSKDVNVLSLKLVFVYHLKLPIYVLKYIICVFVNCVVGTLVVDDVVEKGRIPRFSKPFTS